MKTSISLLFIFLGFSLFALGQEKQKLDSILKVYHSQTAGIEKVKTLDELFKVEFSRETSEKAIGYAKEQLDLSKKIDYTKGKANAYRNIAKYFGASRNLDSTTYYSKLAKAIYEELNDLKNQYEILLNWTRLENLEGSFEKALSLCDETIQIAKNLENGELISDAFSQKSTTYVDQGNYKKAVENLLFSLRALDTLSIPKPMKSGILKAKYGRIELLRGNYDDVLQPLSESLEIFKEQDDKRWQANVYMEIGSLFFHLKEYDKSLENYHNSLEVSYAMNRDDYVAANLGNIGAVFMEQKEYDKALEYFFNSINTAKKRGSVNNEIIGYNDITNAYRGKKEYTKALEFNARSIHLADSVGSLVYLKDAFYNRSRIQEKMGLYEKALKNRKKFEELKDSIFNSSKFKQIEELKTQYETEKKEQQIALQEKEITVLEQQAEISTLQKILLGGLLVLSLIGFYGIRQKLNRNKLEKEKVDAELAFKKKELTTHALHLAKKNEVLESLKQKAQELKENEESKKGYQQLIRTINFDLQDDNNWENFARYFEEVHKDFNSNVKSKYPEVTSNELRLLALLKMNLSSKEIANILNISQEGIKKARYRLRKKLDITTEDSLQDLVLSL
nr:tetratricopeptide repeat protein [uncultured Allomuricauda sp.]